MKIFISMTLGSLLILSCTSKTKNDSSRSPQSELSQSNVLFENASIHGLPYQQRMGYLLESKEVPFKGCIIYLEGLGDSIQNHFPLFNKLSLGGYRVLMFDYLGQGGSEGSMASTRINSAGDPYPKSRAYEIGEQAKFVWDRYSKNVDPVLERSCADSPKRVIGWSTGGLAAYRLAYQGWANKVALIAPGIVPNLCVGEAGHSSLAGCAEKNLTLEHIITKRTLTSNTFEGQSDPHVDPIKPSSFLEIKEFAINLTSTADLQASLWKISKKIQGIVFLSGQEDTYVNRDQTRKVLSRNAPHFEIIAYDGALHEIDNEIPRIADDMHQRTLDFFNGPNAQ